MFETLHKASVDKIFALMAEYAADPRPAKIDLGIGVYKDETGTTPIMSAVRKAEQRIHEGARTKTYIGVAGNKGFCEAIVDLTLEGSVERGRIASAQGPGGTGSLWVLMQLVGRARPNGRIFISDPSWPNHWPMAENSGLSPQFYPYFSTTTRKVDFDAMMGLLDTLGPDDTVLLHACCHNPTGANLSPGQWDRVTDSLARTGAMPLVDLAYLGFGDGIDEDAYGVRRLAAKLPEMMIAFSGSKNFGLYRERAGCAIVITRDEGAAAIVSSQMNNIIRSSYSQPPDHGAEIIRVILADKDLRAEWRAELEAMRTRMITLRENLAAAIRERSNATDFDFIADHRGMFSLLGLPEESVAALKMKDAIYMIGDSRINVAGIPGERIGELADALLAAVR